MSEKPNCTRCGKPLEFAGTNGVWNCNNPDCPEPWEEENAPGVTLSQSEENALARVKLRMLAHQITTNDHFEAILMQANPALRKGVYDEIAPHLRFKPKAWTAMKFNRRNRRKRG